MISSFSYSQLPPKVLKLEGRMDLRFNFFAAPSWGATDLECEGFEGPCDEGNAARQACRTAYSNPDHNRSPVLCAFCAGGYHAYWDDMWSTYYSQIM